MTSSRCIDTTRCTGLHPRWTGSCSGFVIGSTSCSGCSSAVVDPRLQDGFFYLVGTGVLAVVAVIVFRSARGRFTEGLVAHQPEGPRAPADYFAEADRLAARGDRVGAIRNLCAGVAATLAGERTWEGSPLTVREIFQRAPEPARLRPLLLPFEAAVYGGRDVDAATYERAKQVAAPFRQPTEVAA